MSCLFRILPTVKAVNVSKYEISNFIIVLCDFSFNICAKFWLNCKLSVQNKAYFLIAIQKGNHDGMTLIFTFLDVQRSWIIFWNRVIYFLVYSLLYSFYNSNWRIKNRIKKCTKQSCLNIFCKHLN